MNTRDIFTKSLRLVLQTRAETLASIEQMSSEVKAQLSPAWLALLDGSSEADRWIHGFAMVRQSDGKVVGSCGFKGPPDSDGAVEVAYGVDPEYQGKGYATEAAEALANYALQSADVRVVRAHTLPHLNASMRVLTKCAFKHVGELIDPNDGLVWRWERAKTG